MNIRDVLDRTDLRVGADGAGGGAGHCRPAPSLALLLGRPPRRAPLGDDVPRPPRYRTMEVLVRWPRRHRHRRRDGCPARRHRHRRTNTRGRITRTDTTHPSRRGSVGDPTGFQPFWLLRSCMRSAAPVDTAGFGSTRGCTPRAEQVLKDHLVGFDPGVRSLPALTVFPALASGLRTCLSPLQARRRTCRFVTSTQVRCRSTPTRRRSSRLEAGGDLHPHHGRWAAARGEGPPDALIAASAGFRSAAIIDAASISPATIDQLAEAAGSAGVVLALDNDPAGQEATRRLQRGPRRSHEGPGAATRSRLRPH